MQRRKQLSLLLIAMLVLFPTVVLMPADSALAGTGPILESSHGEEGEEMMEDAVTFLVRIENVSDSADVPMLFAPGVWVLHSEDGPLFTSGEADGGYGLEALAEDGDPSQLLGALTDMEFHAGVFNTPAGDEGPGPLLPGSAYEFEVKATPDTPYLSFATMFVQSNDLFIAPDEMGIALFDMDGMAMDAMMHDVSADLLLWDAGTEANEEPGVGSNQAPRQSGANTGPADEMATVRVVDDGFTYPDVTALVKVTIEPVMMVGDDDMMAGDDDMMEEAVTFLVRIENVSGSADVPTLFAPGVWVLHSEAGPLFTSGEADGGYGLEALAEDGDPSQLLGALTEMELHAGVFNTPAGAGGPGPLLPGSAYEFEVKAAPDTPYLSFATMFVQSNDLFIAPDEMGIALFDMDGMAMDAMMHDVSADLLLWDAGTEANEEPGVGPNQAPRQSAANTGPADEMATVRVVDDGFTYPDVSALVKVTIEPVMMVGDDEMMEEKDDMMAGDAMSGEIMLMEDGPTPYTVVAGDSLGSIAKRAYGNSRYWSLICSENSIANCDLIHVGDELMLPTHADAMSMMGDKMMMDKEDGMMGEKDDMESDEDEMMADKDEMESDEDEMMADKDEMESDEDEMMADKDEMESDKEGMMAGDAMSGEITLMEEGFTPYTVVAGDTLGSIAARAYGDASYWAAICLNNSEVTEDCNLIHIGDELMLPSQTDADLFFDEVNAMGPDPDSDEMEEKSDE